jgi:hypothetical protein
VDAFEEVKIWTTGTPAEVGHAAGGMVNFTFKSGTNQIHGSVEDRYQNRVMDHRQYFEQNARVFSTTYHEAQSLLSGPVYIPKLYDGRNKTFFLFAYGRHHEKSNDPQTTTTPDANMLGGNFSFGGLGYPIYDPKSITQLAGGSWTADPFAGKQIPQSRFDPVAVKFLSMNPYTPPNDPGFYSATGPNSNLVGYTIYRAYRTHRHEDRSPVQSEPQDVRPLLGQPASAARPYLDSVPVAGYRRHRIQFRRAGTDRSAECRLLRLLQLQPHSDQ